MLLAETGRVDASQLGMVAAASFGDVVEHAGDIQHFRTGEIVDEFAAKRIFVFVYRQRETAQVAHHHQDMFVHGIDVEEVMLHLPDDAAEGGQVAPQDIQVVHAPQRMGQALRLAEYVHEQPAVVRVLAEGGADQFARTPQRPQRLGGESGQARMLFQQQETFQYGGGIVFQTALRRGLPVCRRGR